MSQIIASIKRIGGLIGGHLWSNRWTIKFYKSVAMKIPMDATKTSGWIAFPTQAFLGFGIGFGLMTFINCVEVEGKVGPDGKRKITSFHRLQARRNPENYLGTI